MTDLDDTALTRLRIGLAALGLALITDACDIQLGDIDVLHDLAAMVLLGVAGWGLSQAASASKAVPGFLFWIAPAAFAVGQGIDALDPSWSAHRGVQMARFGLYAGGLAATAFAMAKLTSKVGLSSSVKWRRSGLQLALMVLVPGLVIALFLMPPAPGLPFHHRVGKIDSTWWKTGISYGAMGLALLAAFDTTMATFTTWRSAGRRQ